MGLDVFAQMVGSHKGLVAYLTGEFLFARVNAHMPMKLIRAGEFFATKWKLTNKWFLARVPSQVRLQVRCLAVFFATAGMMADVHQFLAVNSIL